jgi:hypothetical protein
MKEPNDVVPLFGSWRNAYVAIVVVFVLEVTFFYFVSRFFS